MNKKYKLIKEYPGSPELGTIAEKHSIDGIAYTYAGKTIYEASSESGLFQKIISTQPEFWEEVVEKDYEILSFIVTENNETNYAKLDNNNLFQGRYIIGCGLEYMLKKYKIYSIKRLSDGEIFTVGDKIKTSIELTIQSFIIIDNELLINPREIIGTISLNKVSKLKQPLFTTEDGVDIYQGDKYYSVQIPTFSLCKHTIGIIPPKSKHFKRFSTKEKAEEYILLNKPCLSIQDVLNCYEWNNYSIKNSIKGTEVNLKELVKSKL